MAVLRFVFTAFGLLLALSIAGYPHPFTAQALYMPQGFNLAAARNETDGRLAQAATHSYDDMGPTAMASAGTLVPRDIWSPVILSPDGNVVWRAGSIEEVKWCADLYSARLVKARG